MRELKLTEYHKEITECEKELEYTIKSILKKKGESVPYNFIMMAKDNLMNKGIYELCGLTLKYNTEKVLVYDYCEKDDFEEYSKNANDVKIISEDDGVYNITFVGEIDKVAISGDSALFKVYTTTEAAQLWGFNESTVRKAIQNGKFKLGIDYRKAGRVTFITKEAMERVYGEPKEN